MEAMKTAVVTGGAGFLGSNLCDHLLGKGYRVICVDNLETGSLENLAHIPRGPGFEFVYHDVIQHIDIDGPVDCVYHLAALASPIDYMRLPLHSLKVGSYGTHHALGLAARVPTITCVPLPPHSINSGSYGPHTALGIAKR